MAYKRKTWTEKLNEDKGFPKIFRIAESKRNNWGTGTCVIAAPTEVDALMKKVPKGRLTTIDGLRKVLATRHGTTMACPITTGISAWISAHAAEESRAAGGQKTTPYWRTLKSGGELNPKYPGGIAALKRKLSVEGHAFVQRGGKVYVKEFEKRLAALR